MTALAPFSRAHLTAQNPEHSFEASRDRILITLLALDLMLMAFFVVMNSAATFDAKRGAEAASSMQAAPSSVAPAAPADADARGALGLGTNPRFAASAELRAAVADVFANFLPAGTGPVASADDGRIDVDMPGDLAAGDELPEALRAGVAHVMENPPPGYRTELVIRAPEEQDLAGLAHLAQDLVSHGVAAGALSVGMLTKDSTDSARHALRFTFLLLEPGEGSRAAHVVMRKAHP